MKNSSNATILFAIFLGGVLGAICRSLIHELPLTMPFVNYFSQHLPLEIDFETAPLNMDFDLHNPLTWFIFFHFFPLEIFIVNLTGSFFIGVAIAYFTYKNTQQIAWRNFFITGFLGSFTTFSTFILDTIKLILPLFQENIYIQAIFPKLAARTDVFNTLFHQIPSPFKTLEPTTLIYLAGINTLSNIIACLLAVAIGHGITKRLCT